MSVAAAKMDAAPAGKWRSVGLLVFAEIVVLALWFMSAAVLPEMQAEAALSPFRAAALSSLVQIGFVVGALGLAIGGVADRFDPRWVVCLAALAAAGANALLTVTVIGGPAQMGLRFLTGAFLAGAYPPAMKIIVGWGVKDRGYLVGLLVGALTVGSAAPHMLALIGGADWRLTVWIASAGAAIGGLSVLAARLGPHHARAHAFDPRALSVAWTNRRVRLAIAGYLAHMWELYSFWAWVATFAAAAYAAGGYVGGEGWDVHDAGRLTAFFAIALGGFACVPAGRLGDRLGKARVAQYCLVASGAAGLASALCFGGPIWLTALVLIVWGIAIIPDSGQYSALVADAAPPELAGGLMTLQTAFGFTLSFATVQATPMLAHAIGWPWTLAAMAIGPALGVAAMRRLIALGPGRG